MVYIHVVRSVRRALPLRARYNSSHFLAVCYFCRRCLVQRPTSQSHQVQSFFSKTFPIFSFVQRMCGVVVKLFVDFQFPPAGRAPVPVRLFVGARDQVFRDTTMVGDPMVRVGHLFFLFFWKQTSESERKKQTSGGKKTN